MSGSQEQVGQQAGQQAVDHGAGDSSQERRVQQDAAGPTQDPPWLGARLERERAKFADYEDLKAKAAKLDEIEAANQTELQKVQARAEAAEKAQAEAVSQALRLRVAVKHGISDEDADLFLVGTDEATLTKQAERLAGRAKRQNTHVSGQGNNTPPSGGSSDERLAVKQLFASGD